MLKGSQGHKNIFHLGKPAEPLAGEDRNSFSYSCGNMSIPAVEGKQISVGFGARFLFLKYC